ncbi:hypothetical protein GALMADRAFT_257801 [Galerina marginata CBS 339.88]|uniref:Uncharacterized protein n=1 Tax=Galerina marginata (strain CBS 339.88) TaxID=685588 RepID=A0A067SM91_GALM3|nr:hypothetical protein GALMADRAFT_257801 [Galerina marginata CBS 339.88]
MAASRQKFELNKNTTEAESRQLQRRLADIKNQEDDSNDIAAPPSSSVQSEVQSQTLNSLRRVCPVLGNCRRQPAWRGVITPPERCPINHSSTTSQQHTVQAATTSLVRRAQLS